MTTPSDTDDRSNPAGPAAEPLVVFAQPVHSVDVRQPPANTYVLARYARGNWHDGDDQAGCIWKVVKFIPASSNADGNNERPWHWREFGPGIWFGQDFDQWCDLPREQV